MPIMIEYVVFLHIRVCCILVTHCNVFLNFSLLAVFICMERDCIFLSVRSSKTINQSFLSSLKNPRVTIRSFFKKSLGKKVPSVFQSSGKAFSLQSFHSFILSFLVCCESVAVKSAALSAIIFFCRNYTKKPMNNQKPPA